MQKKTDLKNTSVASQLMNICRCWEDGMPREHMEGPCHTLHPYYLILCISFIWLFQSWALYKNPVIVSFQKITSLEWGDPSKKLLLRNPATTSHPPRWHVGIQTASVHAKLLQSCPTLCDPMDCSLPDSSVHEILEARGLDWVAISSFKGSSPDSITAPPPTATIQCLNHTRQDHVFQS